MKKYIIIFTAGLIAICSSAYAELEVANGGDARLIVTTTTPSTPNSSSGISLGETDSDGNYIEKSSITINATYNDLYYNAGGESDIGTHFFDDMLSTEKFKLTPHDRGNCTANNNGEIVLHTDAEAYICINNTWEEYRGPRGADGDPGLNCWDINENGVGDLANPNEDINGDGEFDYLDCIGSGGTNGIDCWDIDGDGIGDFNNPDEDINGDEEFNYLDCIGSTGINCWDLNGNGIGDFNNPNEDINGDTFFNHIDCGGYHCWDTNLDGLCGDDEDGDDEECTIQDCIGPQGEYGISCWDINGNGECDGSEGGADSECTVEDCIGSEGTNGLNCWDIDGDGIGDFNNPNEDINGDGEFDYLDCIGPKGDDGNRGDDGSNGSDGGRGDDGTNGTNGFHCWDTNQSHACDNGEGGEDEECTVEDDCIGSGSSADSLFQVNADDNSSIFYNGGKVGIGTSAPSEKLDVVGGINMTGSIKYSPANMRFYQNVASYTSTSSAFAGTMKIKLPKTWSNTMMSIRIQGYNYDDDNSGNGSWDVMIGGYNYSGAPSWVNYSADIRGAAPFRKVRLAHDGDTNVILLGELSTIWKYPKIVISEFMAGYNSLDGWGSGWEFSRLLSESGISHIETPTIRMIQTASGNVGIGTTDPGEKLEVAGKIKINDGTAAADYILKSTDADGTAEWVAPGEIMGDTDQQSLHALPSALGSELNIDRGGSVTFEGGDNILVSHMGSTRIKIDASYDATANDQTLEEVLTKGNNAGNLEIRNVNGISVGTSSSTYPGTRAGYFNGVVQVTDHLLAEKGVHIGGVSNPGTDNLIVDGEVDIGGNLDVAGSLDVVGNLDVATNMKVAGQAGIGTTVLAASSDLNMVGSIKYSPANMRFYQNVASYTSTSSAFAGTMKIKLPKTWSNTMMSIRIQGYNYDDDNSGNGSWEVMIGGYNYSGAPSWVNYSADIRGAAPFRKVRLAHDGDTNVILLGELSTIWKYPKIFISEFMAGYSSLDGWGSGWEFSRLTSESGISHIETPTIRMIQTASGNVGIGTTNPSTKLEVAGDISSTGLLNVNNGVASGVALKVNGDEALWYNGSRFSWGYGGSTNYFADKVGIGDNDPDGNLKLDVAGNVGANAYCDSNGINCKTISELSPKTYRYTCDDGLRNGGDDGYQEEWCGPSQTDLTNANCTPFISYLYQNDTDLDQVEYAGCHIDDSEKRLYFNLHTSGNDRDTARYSKCGAICGMQIIGDSW